MGITDRCVLNIGNPTVDQCDAKYRDNCGLKGYEEAQAETKVYLYLKNAAPKHAAKPWTCANCPCDAISKWGCNHDYCYRTCHPKDVFPSGSPWGSIGRWYVQFAISFSGTTVQVDQEKTVTVTAKRGTDPVEDVELEYTVADPSKLVIKGKAEGWSSLTIKQTQGDEGITSGLQDSDEITVTPAP